MKKKESQPYNLDVIRLEMLIRVLDETNHDIEETARRLGKGRATIYRWKKDFLCCHCGHPLPQKKSKK